MGYTHYWNFKNDVAPKDIEGGKAKFFKAVFMAAKCLKKVEAMGIKVCGGNGEGLPVFKDGYISFNGCREKGENHETFSINTEDGAYNFCKTNEKPYNLLVCLALLAFKWAFGKDFTYKSDGITKEAYENRESNAYWKQIGFVPEGPSKDWVTAYEVWEQVKKEMGIVLTL